MTELILSDITRMGPGHCIIGLEKSEAGYRSVRPLPRWGAAWPAPFEHRRGERLLFTLSTLPSLERPHVEDRPSSGTVEKLGEVNEAELIACLRKAELAERQRDLFGLPVQMKRRGAYIWPNKGDRSICGVDGARLRVFMEGREVRATVGLPSGESLANLKVVDHSWNTFVDQALKQIEGITRLHRLNRFFEGRLSKATQEQRFVRLGVTRATPICWLMVDSLFPMPRQSWLRDLVAEGSPELEAEK